MLLQMNAVNLQLFKCHSALEGIANKNVKLESTHWFICAFVLPGDHASIIAIGFVTCYI